MRSCRNRSAGRPAAALLTLLAAAPAAAQQAEEASVMSYEASAILESVHVLEGGLRTGHVQQSLLHAGARLDTGAAGWWEGGAFFVRLGRLSGGEPSSRRSGLFQTGSHIEGETVTVVDRLGYEHAFADSGAELRVGLWDMSDGFTVAEPTGSFVNSSFGFQPDLGLNLPLSTFPISTLGARLFWTSPRLDLRAAVFDGIPPTTAQTDGRIRLTSPDSDGLFLVGEAAWRPSGEEPGGLEARLGAWRHTTRFAADATGADPAGVLDGNHGFYAVGSGLLAGEAAGRGLDGFLKTGWAPEDRNAVTLFLGGGLRWRGPFAARPGDELGLGFGRVGFSPTYRGATGVGPHETFVELSYGFDLGHGVVLRPDLQWVRHPSAAPGLDDAWILVLRAEWSW
jgi:porin